MNALRGARHTCRTTPTGSPRSSAPRRDSVDQAIRNGIARASQTLRDLDWFEVTQVRGQIENGQIAHCQVGLKVGFRLEDERPTDRRDRDGRSGPALPLLRDLQRLGAVAQRARTTVNPARSASSQTSSSSSTSTRISRSRPAGAGSPAWCARAGLRSSLRRMHTRPSGSPCAASQSRVSRRQRSGRPVR